MTDFALMELLGNKQCIKETVAQDFSTAGFFIKKITPRPLIQHQSLYNLTLNSQILRQGSLYMYTFLPFCLFFGCGKLSYELKFV
jgi:hypothetical protein